MPTLSSPIRLLALLALAVAGGLLASGVSPAKADDAYRYWTYWWGADGSWEYGSTGPADRMLSQGDVEGWLFQTTAEDVPTSDPGAAPDFEDLCAGSSPAGDGQIQVAVVVDYGTSADTPAGQTLPDGPTIECVALPEGSNGLDALTAATEVRSDNGAICGINGYPTAGCFEVVTAEEPDEPGRSPALWLSLVGILVVAAVVAFLVVRNRNATRQ